MEYVYWIKRKMYDDPYAEGYIGISNNPEQRFLSHAKSNTRVGNAIRKYSDIEMVILGSFDTRDLVLSEELKYRPHTRIGWNVQKGGQCPPEDKTIETIEKIRKTIKSFGVIPYSDKTHSDQSLKKSKLSKEKSGNKWFHNPSTGETTMFATNLIDIPQGWVKGRIPEKPKKIQYIDYWRGANKSFIVIDPEGNRYIIENNLKKWCKEMGIGYLSAAKNKTWKGWRIE